MHYVSKKVNEIFALSSCLNRKSNSINTNSIALSRKTRVVYRISQEKLDKYHLEYNSKFDNKKVTFDENKNSYVQQKTTLSLMKIINQKTINTQTNFDSSTNLIDQCANPLSIIPDS